LSYAPTGGLNRTSHQDSILVALLSTMGSDVDVKFHCRIARTNGPDFGHCAQPPVRLTCIRSRVVTSGEEKQS